MPDEMDTAEPGIYEFGGFRLDTHRRLLLGQDGHAIDLPTKGFDTLVYFLERPGAVIGRKTLLSAIWPTTVVEENNLSQAIAAVRRALGPESVLTVPRQGYQFALRVRQVASLSESQQIAESKPDSSGPIGGEGRTDRGTFLAAAAAAATVIVTGAAIAITFAGRFGSYQHQVGADFESHGGATIGLAIVRGGESLPTDSYQAYDRFLAAQEAPETSEGLAVRIAELNEAIRLDPRFALAHAQLASAYASRARLALELGEFDIEEDVLLARQSGERAIELDSSLGEAHAMLALTNIIDGDMRGVRDGLRTALQVSPDHPMVVHMAGLYSLLANHRADAREFYVRYARFDRYGFDYYMYYLAGDLHSAQERAYQATEERPTDVYPRINLALYYTLSGDRDSAERELRLVEAMSERLAPDPVILACLAYAYGRNDFPIEARNAFAKLVAATPDPTRLHAAHWVYAYLGIGDIESAYSWAMHVADHPYPFVPGPQTEFFLNATNDPALEEPRFVTLRQPPEFEALRRLPGLLD